MKRLPAAPTSFSDSPKLMLKMVGGLGAFSMFSMAMKPPKLAAPLARESAQFARTICAAGAAAEDHSTSIAASPSAPLTPGSAQATAPVGWTTLRLLPVGERGG